MPPLRTKAKGREMMLEGQGRYILTFLVKCATIGVSERELRFSFEDLVLAL